VLNSNLKPNFSIEISSLFGSKLFLSMISNEIFALKFKAKKNPELEIQD